VALRSRFVVRDRDGKFGPEFNTVWEAGGAKVICTPVRAPNANAIAERFVRTTRAECTHRLLLINERHARRALKRYLAHYNEHRPHRALQLDAPQPRAPQPRAPQVSGGTILPRPVLGGLINEYTIAA
jgi:hypothetical protein